MNDCLIKRFGLEKLVEHSDCKHCPFKSKSECKKAMDKVLKKAEENFFDYMHHMDFTERLNLYIQTENAIHNVFIYEESKKLLKEMGVKLS